MGLYVKEAYVNATLDRMIGETDVYEAWTDETGKLYRTMQREYGRCIGKVYIDTDEGVKAVGWVFQKRDRYEDTDETYLREVWVTVHDAVDTVERTHHYHAIG